MRLSVFEEAAEADTDRRCAKLGWQCGDRGSPG